jgi:hypothetical protein
VALSLDKRAETAFWQHKCRSSLYWFFREAYGYDRNPKGALSKTPWLTDQHKQLADWFTFHAKEWMRDRMLGLGKPKKILAVVPRDFGKTTLLAQAGQIWLHVHDPEIATYTGCDTLPRAREILNGIKMVIGGEDSYSNYTQFYGNQLKQGRKWKIEGVVTADRTNLTRRDDSYGIWAVETGMVGLHPDGGFFDDPNTYERMARHNNWLDIVNDHFATLIPVFQKDALWCLTATRYGDGDHVGTILKNEGCASITGMKMPDVVISPDGAWHVFFLDAEDADGHPTMPTIWPLHRIKTFKDTNIVRYFAQVRNNPKMSPYKILTESSIKKMYIPTLPRERLRRLRISLHADTAFKNPKRRARGDMNVIAAVGHEPKTGKCIFVGARFDQDWQSTEFRDAMIEQVKLWRSVSAGVFAITDEEEIGGKPGLWQAFLETAFKLKNVRMPELLIFRRRNDRSKEDRLSEVAGLWAEGRMELVEGAPGLEQLTEQMGNIGLTKYDDFADAVGDCFNKRVYNVVWATKAAESARSQSNPFDEVLKQNGLGDAAAEQIAKEFDERAKQWDGLYFDAVHP